MATAKKRSTKSTAASPKAAEKTASSRATKPGSQSAPSRASGGAKTTSKAATSKGAPPARAGKTSAPAAGKSAAGKSAAAKSAAAKPTAKTGKKDDGAMSARAKVASAVDKAAKAARKVAARVTGGKGTSRTTAGDAALFASLTDGERAEALRLLTEDQRLSGMANVGRYRVIAVEPLVVKAPADVADHRLARAVVYDYSSERSVDASIDLDTGKVVHLNVARTQPMLSREEEAAAIAIAIADEQVKSKLAPGDEPQVAMHYWSRRDTSLAYSRRAAAVLLGQPRGATSLIAVVDLLDNLVCEIVPAAEW